MKNLLFLFLLLYGFIANGQIATIFNRLTQADGLNTNRVNCIWQDSIGFLWIGTENGLQRFDGSKFVRFGSDGKEASIPPLGIDQIFGADSKRLWLRVGNEIGFFNKATFRYSRIPLDVDGDLPPQTELRLFPDNKGHMFLAVRDYGLMWFDPQKKLFSTKNIPLKIPRDWNGKIHCLFQDTIRQEYWMCADEGVACYQVKTGKLISKDNNPEQVPIFNRPDLKYVFDIHRDKNDRLWLVYWNLKPESEGSIILKYDLKTNQSVADTVNLNVSSNRFEVIDWIYESRLGQIWLGGLSSLYYSDPERTAINRILNTNSGSYSINCRNVKQAYEDRENNLWFCTDNGLYVVAADQKHVYNYSFENDFSDDVLITSFIETRSLENWVSTWGKGIIFFDQNFHRIDKDVFAGKTSRSSKMIWSLCEQSESGLIWAAGRDGQILVLEPNTKEVLKQLKPPVFESPGIRESSTIFKIVETKNGDLLFATNGGKLIRWEKGSPIENESFREIHRLDSPVRCLFIDSKQQIWLGTTTKGVYVLDESGRSEKYHFDLAASNSHVSADNWAYDIVEYNDSTYFVGSTFLNIIRFPSGKITRLTEINGLPGLHVRQMILDKEGILWFNCNNGLVSYNPVKNTFASFNEKNGIVYAGKRAPAKFYMRNGEIWFGGENSLYGFVPESLGKKKVPLNVTITDFRILNSYIPLDSLLSAHEVKLKANQNSLIFYFSTLSFLMQDQLIYYYRLNGVNQDWVRAEGEPHANYTTLPPGRYTFEVKCANMQGEESPVTSFDFRILPHFYQSWWFISIISLLAIWLIYFIYRLQLTKLLAIERVRNKVARDLHDDVGSTLSTINILSSMAKTKLLTDPVKTSEYISKITENSQHMMEAMDDIVWSIKPDNDSLHKIVARMREYASGILEPKDIEIEFEVTENIHDLKLSMENRRDIFLIFKEAINNIAKYAHCGQVNIQLRLESRRLVMRIQDNGTGFNLGTADEGNGLGNMQKRAESLNGRIQFESSQGKGTSILLDVPVNG